MVVKTEQCAFSEHKVYPGHGSRFVTRTGQLVVLSGSKTTSLYHQKKKPAKLLWTQAWRRLHKKMNVEGGIKKKARRVIKQQHRSVVGASMDELKQKKAAAKPAVKAPAGAAATKHVHAAVAEAKAKQKEAQAKKKAEGGKGKQPVAAKHAGKGR